MNSPPPYLPAIPLPLETDPVVNCTCSAQVVVTEGAPTYQGQQMARELAAAGIRATLIADSAVFAMMARVNKVRSAGWNGWNGAGTPGAAGQLISTAMGGKRMRLAARLPACCCLPVRPPSPC